MIDDHDQTSRAEEDTNGDGSTEVVWLSHLKFGRLSRGADGKYTMTTTASAKLETQESDASESANFHLAHQPARAPLPRVL